MNVSDTAVVSNIFGNDKPKKTHKFVVDMYKTCRTDRILQTHIRKKIYKKNLNKNKITVSLYVITCEIRLDVTS